MNDEGRHEGFAITLDALREAGAPADTLQLLGLALGEAPLRRQALRFLLREGSPAAVRQVLERFASLGPAEQAEAMLERNRLAAAAPAALGSIEAAGEGLACFAALLPLSEGLTILAPLLEHPDGATRRLARSRIVSASRDYAAGLTPLTAPADRRRYLAALSSVLGSAAAPDEIEPLAGALLRLAGEAPEALAPLGRILAGEMHPARPLILKALGPGGDPAAAGIILGLASSPPPGRDAASEILESRREPEFLAALACEAAMRMESPAGITAPAARALASVAWEALPAEALGRLPESAQRRLLAILARVRASRNRVRRVAAFLRSPKRRVRELALEALRTDHPSLYREELLSLLGDPAEELRSRASALLARAREPEPAPGAMATYARPNGGLSRAAHAHPIPALAASRWRMEETS